ncbi:MAG: DUF2148 domain-containing protein [Chloroflexota bacterium]
MNGIRMVADLMAVAARTAPKTRGDDYVVVEIVEGKALRRLGEGMIAYGERSGRANFDRDGQNVLDSAAVVLIGLKDADTIDLNCGACGAETCIVPNTFEGEFKGPNCALRHLDMGIALGSAAKIAGLLNVDSRIMYRAGVVARQLHLIDADFVMGIPISATGKNIYFDRQPKK